MLNDHQPMSSDHADASAHVGRVPLHRWLDPRFWLRMILLLEDTPHSIALGSTIGMFIAFIPPFGLQQFIYFFIIAICRPFFRFNIPAGYVLLYVSNPLTSPFIYWMNYKVGTIFLEGDVTYDHLIEKIQHTDSRSWTDFMIGLWQLMLELGWPFLLGSFVVAAVFALPTYPLMYHLSKRYQRRVKIHEEHVHEKQLLKEKELASHHPPEEISAHQPEATVTPIASSTQIDSATVPESNSLVVAEQSVNAQVMQESPNEPEHKIVNANVTAPDTQELPVSQQLITSLEVPVSQDAVVNPEKLANEATSATPENSTHDHHAESNQKSTNMKLVME